MSPDERIKELKKQGYISGVMAGKRIWERMQVIPDLCAYTSTISTAIIITTSSLIYKLLPAQNIGAFII